MHLTLKKEATRPPGMNSLQQQARFDDFVQEFNTERPHEALAMKCPAEIYSASSRPYSGLPDLTYPLHDRDALVTACDRICMHRKRVNGLVKLSSIGCDSGLIVARVMPRRLHGSIARLLLPGRSEASTERPGDVEG
jgi:hypothetical protein